MNPERARCLILAVAAALAAAGAACGSSASSTSPASPQRTIKLIFQTSSNSQLDMLFVVDNTGSMGPYQGALTAAFSRYAGSLAAMPRRAPDLHIAVVSSDMGAGPMPVGTACVVGGDGGRFHTAPGIPGCSTGLPAGQNFLSIENGQPNFTGALGDGFACLATLGENGCGFEHPFASLLKALEPNGLPAGNANFLRPNASLAIIFLTNEDDCSAPPDSMLFDPSSQLVSDPLGPLTSFRCNEFGHLCDGQRPPRTPAMLDNCTSAEDGTLLKVADVVSRITTLKNGDTSKILVSAIAGPTTPYRVFLQPGTTAGGVTENQPAIDSSCRSATGAAAPAVRIKMLVDAFRGTVMSICGSSYDQVLDQFIDSRDRAGPPCIDGRLVDIDATAPGVQPDCAITDVTTDSQGDRQQTPVPSCARSAGATPCWSIDEDAQSCPAQADTTRSLLTIKRAEAPSTNLLTEVSCAACIPGVASDGCR